MFMGVYSEIFTLTRHLWTVNTDAWECHSGQIKFDLNLT